MAKEREKDFVTYYRSGAKWVAVSSYGPTAKGDTPEEAAANLKAAKAERGDCQNVWR